MMMHFQPLAVKILGQECLRQPVWGRKQKKISEQDQDAEFSMLSESGGRGGDNSGDTGC